MRSSSLLLSVLPMSIWGLVVRLLGDVNLSLAYGFLVVSALAGAVMLSALWRMTRMEPAAAQPPRVTLLEEPSFAAHARRAANDARRRAA